MSLSRTVAAAAMTSLLALCFAPVASGESPPCPGCEPRVASWDWKANGYAVAATAADAEAAAIVHALEQGCPVSFRYLAASKQRCPAGCTPGEPLRECAPKSKPGCKAGSYDEGRDAWVFACRKAKGKDARDGCDPDDAASAPFFATCDVPLHATVTLPCGKADCDER